MWTKSPCLKYIIQERSSRFQYLLEAGLENSVKLKNLETLLPSGLFDEQFHNLFIFLLSKTLLEQLE